MAVIIILCFLALYLVFIKPFSIDDSETAIQRSIEHSTDQRPITIQKVKDVGKLKVVLFTTVNHIGESILEKGINNKLRIRRTGHGTSKIRYFIIESAGSRYIALLGENNNLGSAKISVGGVVYNFAIPQERFFICLEKINNPHESVIEWVVLYDTTKKEALRINLPEDINLD
ncbi:hypothetical protein [Cohnella nanjingensis]|uniref:Uncharacterized protein n=1 Tax=Cohnella nanjingensis TaxID=1387779 RepID=A0A7X0VF79_9BACL|nr:hypothetical protein [Cohnella nanjingensis]MBB6670329.1 hypothetical protein [Cohnella nanjingensis]